MRASQSVETSGSSVDVVMVKYSLLSFGMRRQAQTRNLEVV